MINNKSTSSYNCTTGNKRESPVTLNSCRLYLVIRMLKSESREYRLTYIKERCIDSLYNSWFAGDKLIRRKEHWNWISEEIYLSDYFNNLCKSYMSGGVIARVGLRWEDLLGNNRDFIREVSACEPVSLWYYSCFLAIVRFAKKVYGCKNCPALLAYLTSTHVLDQILLPNINKTSTPLTGKFGSHEEHDLYEKLLDEVCEKFDNICDDGEKYRRVIVLWHKEKFSIVAQKKLDKWHYFLHDTKVTAQIWDRYCFFKFDGIRTIRLDIKALIEEVESLLKVKHVSVLPKTGLTQHPLKIDHVMKVAKFEGYV